jgi:arylsulfatase A-like enzyme
VVDVSGPTDSPTDRGPYAGYLRERGLLEKAAADLHERYVTWEFEPRASVVPPEHYHDTFVARAAIDYIDARPKDRPMFLVVSFHSPHPPLDAPGGFATMYDPQSLRLPANVPETAVREKRHLDAPEIRRMLANYLGKISLVDDQIGRLVEALKRRGTWDDTLVIFTADHGEMMGAHGAFTKGRFYEESVRVPLVVRRPGTVRAGRTTALAESMDIYPTIVESIGGKMTPGRFARSLWPVATGKTAGVRDVVLSEIGKSAPLDIMIRDERYKWWAQDDDEYLFDLTADPLEMNNLAASTQHRETADRMRSQLVTYLRNTQVNLAEGAKSKIQRLREQEAANAKKGK